MAVTQRILNSTMPFSMSIDQPKVEALGCLPQHCSSSTDSATKVSSFLQKIISHGTAKHMGAGPLATEKLSFIAQEENESLESQEFCPNTSSTFSYGRGTWSRRPCRKRARRQRRRVGERETSQRDSETTTETGLSGVQEQHSGEVEKFSSSSTSCSSETSVSTESLCVQETIHPFLSSQPFSPLVFSPLFNLHLPSLEAPPSCDVYGQESVSPLPSESNCSLAVSALRSYVTHADRCYAPPFIHQLVREYRQEELNDGSGEEQEEVCANEGILFTEDLQPSSCEYREGVEYEVCEMLNQGTYGDVYSIKDRTSGFTCAAKKILMRSFNSEEVGSWSVLHSPHVLELFGFVREGPFIILFMDLKPGSLAQLLKQRGCLSEDLSLYYLHQVLGALEHLHKRHVLHLDIKAENVLLSADGKDTFLCDFGQSEQTDQQGFSPFCGLKGTETHMAPEVARGETHCTKADVWSSCCMLLHMLSGCQPWIRYFSRPLYLKIAEEPPPLREIPPDCNTCTAEVITWGLEKEPSRRPSARELAAQTAKALQQLGGLHSPVRGGAYQKPIGKPERSDPTPLSPSSVLQWMGPGQWRDGAGGRAECLNPEVREVEEVEDVEDEHDEDEEEENVERSEGYTPLSTELTEQELRKLEMDLYISSLSHLHSVEQQEQLLSNLGSDCLSRRESWDKKDSGRWSVGPGDDLSSGVFSYNSQSDCQSFSMDWLGPAPQPPPRCFEGVDVCIRDFSGQCLRIRETPRVKVGHVAVGISDQISERVFSLCRDDGSLVHHDEEVKETGLFLRCVPAPDCRHAQTPRDTPCCKSRHTPSCKAPWSWRIRDGELEAWD